MRAGNVRSVVVIPTTTTFVSSSTTPPARAGVHPTPRKTTRRRRRRRRRHQRDREDTKKTTVSSPSTPPPVSAFVASSSPSRALSIQRRHPTASEDPRRSTSYHLNTTRHTHNTLQKHTILITNRPIYVITRVPQTFPVHERFTKKPHFAPLTNHDADDDDRVHDDSDSVRRTAREQDAGARASPTDPVLPFLVLFLIR